MNAEERAKAHTNEKYMTYAKFVLDLARIIFSLVVVSDFLSLYNGEPSYKAALLFIIGIVVIFALILVARYFINKS